MPSAFIGNNAPEVTAHQRRQSDLRHRILKLRWIGKDEEAELLITNRRRLDGTTPVCQFELSTD